jgi:hypothetical protein
MRGFGGKKRDGRERITYTLSIELTHSHSYTHPHTHTLARTNLHRGGKMASHWGNVCPRGDFFTLRKVVEVLQTKQPFHVNVLAVVKSVSLPKQTRRGSGTCFFLLLLVVNVVRDGSCSVHQLLARPPWCVQHGSAYWNSWTPL